MSEAPSADRAQAKSTKSVRSVRGRMRLALGIQMGLLFIGSLGFLWTQDQLRAARGSIVHTHEVIALVQELRAETFIQVANLRGYAMTGHRNYLESHLSGREHYSTLVSQIRGITRDNAAQQERVSRITHLLQDWRDEVVAPVLENAQGASDSGFATESTSRRAETLLGQASIVMKEMLEEEQRLLSERGVRTERIADTMTAMILVILVLGLLAGAFAIRSIQVVMATPLSELSTLARKIARTGKGKVPYQHRRDEIGALASALEQMREAVADQLRTNWIEERASKAIQQLQSCETHSAFGTELLRGLCLDLGAGYGLAYRWDEQAQILDWCASYAMPQGADHQRRFRRGEGLVGQSMVEQKLIRLKKVPEGYLQVVSGLGAALPASLVIMPLVARGEVIAVIELGLLQPLSTAQESLLEELQVPVALAWDALTRALHTRELLKESQTQAEELKASEEALRVQQEELRSINEVLKTRSDQLEAQGRQLKSSEESLRAQTEELRVSNVALEEKSEALRTRQVELEHARQALENKADELERASQYKSEFLANMSHELRTPLNSMLILSRTLAENPDGTLSADEVESARVIHDSGKSLLELINDILDLSKVEAGKMQFHWEDVALGEVFRQLERRFRPVAQNRGLDFRTDLSADLPATIVSDPQRLTQVITNLLSNAFKFTQEGHVALKARAVSGGVAIQVSDSGIGIAQDKLERVFQAFEQAESGTTRRFGGTGLGLSIVNGMTQQLGGCVRVESVPNQGSTFSIYLPHKPGESIPSAAADGSAAVRPPPLIQKPSEPDRLDANGTLASPRVTVNAHKREPLPVAPESAPSVVVVVEDDEHFASVLCNIVRSKGLEAQHAASGAEAKKLLLSYQPKAMLLDIGLPDMDGWDLLAQIRATPALAGMPVHVISGLEEADEASGRGASSYHSKPVATPQILAALDQVGLVPGKSRQRLLIVMDHESHAQRIRELLAATELEIEVTLDPEEATGLLRKERFDGVVISPDLGLRQASDFLSEVSGIKDSPPVLVYSSRPLTTEESRALREFSASIVVEGTRSKERLLDEVNLFLHAVKPAPTTSAASAPGATGIGGAYNFSGKTVLVVDDDMRNTFALSKALRARGLTVVMAQDGQKALAQLESRPDIDLVLMDIMMPGMDGYQATRRIRENPDWQSLPVIAVTAKAMSGDREKCLAAGANDYCAKPIDIEQLLSQMQVWLT